MTLEQSTIDAVRHDWQSLAKPQKHDYMVLIYRILFNQHPEYKPLFHTELEVMRNNMTNSMDLVIRNLDNPQRLQREFFRLGKVHQQAGITEIMFQHMVGCQIQAWQEVMGKPASQGSQRHWSILVNYLAHRIQQNYPQDSS